MTSNEGDPLPSDVVALLRTASRPLGYQLAAARGPVAAVVTAPDVAWPLPGDAHVMSTGARCSVLPMEAVTGAPAFAELSLARRFEGPLEPGQLWCLVIWREGGEELALVARMRPLTAPTRGSA